MDVTLDFGIEIKMLAEDRYVKLHDRGEIDDRQRVSTLTNFERTRAGCATWRASVTDPSVLCAHDLVHHRLSAREARAPPVHLGWLQAEPQDT